MGHEFTVEHHGGDALSRLEDTGIAPFCKKLAHLEW